MDLEVGHLLGAVVTVWAGVQDGVGVVAVVQVFLDVDKVMPCRPVRAVPALELPVFGPIPVWVET
jgi:hypothetical protein